MPLGYFLTKKYFLGMPYTFIKWSGSFSIQLP
jgi:hypothetical protein